MGIPPWTARALGCCRGQGWVHCWRRSPECCRLKPEPMLPAHLAESIRKQVLLCLQSTFDFRDREVDKAFERFLGDPENGLFKEPGTLLRRPYRPADVSETVKGSVPSIDISAPSGKVVAWRGRCGLSMRVRSTT